MNRERKCCTENFTTDNTPIGQAGVTGRCALRIASLLLVFTTEVCSQVSSRFVKQPLRRAGVSLHDGLTSDFACWNFRVQLLQQSDLYNQFLRRSHRFRNENVWLCSLVKNKRHHHLFSLKDSCKFPACAHNSFSVQYYLACVPPIAQYKPPSRPVQYCSH